MGAICLEFTKCMEVGPIQFAVVNFSTLFTICKIKLLLKGFLFVWKVQLREEHVVCQIFLWVNPNCMNYIML